MGSSLNETPIQETKYEVEEEKEPLHVEMETTSSEVFNFNGSSEMDLTDLLEYIKGKIIITRKFYMLIQM